MSRFDQRQAKITRKKLSQATRFSWLCQILHYFFFSDGVKEVGGALMSLVPAGVGIRWWTHQEEQVVAGRNLNPLA